MHVQLATNQALIAPEAIGDDASSQTIVDNYFFPKGTTNLAVGACLVCADIHVIMALADSQLHYTVCYRDSRNR